MGRLGCLSHQDLQLRPWCVIFLNKIKKKLPEKDNKNIKSELKKLKKKKKKFGDNKNPLLVSVRSAIKNFNARNDGYNFKPWFK